MGSRKILYVDMDNVLVDFESGIARLPAEIVQSFEGRPPDLNEFAMTPIRRSSAVLCRERPSRCS